MPRLEFSDHPSSVHKAIVASLDLTGFSTFCNQSEPSVAVTVPQLVKRVFDTLNAGLSQTMDEAETHNLILAPTEDGKLPLPTLNKFTGDGALMFWLRPAEEQFTQEFCNQVVQTTRDYQKILSEKLPVWEKEWRVRKVPRHIRIKPPFLGGFSQWLRPTLSIQRGQFYGYT